MLTIQQVKTILNNPNLSDTEATEIRDNFRSLAEVIFEQWEREKKVKQNNENDNEISITKI